MYGIDSSVQDQLNYWQNRCMNVERKVLNQINQESALKSSGGVYTNLLEEVRSIKRGLYETDLKWNGRFTALSEEVFGGQQYDRRNNAIIEGYKYLPNMSNLEFILATVRELNYLFPSLKNSIRPHHIDDAHPLPTKSGMPKKVIIKFANRWVKTAIIKCSADLKGSGLSVTEHITPYTSQLLKAASDVVGAKNTSVYNTTVFAEHGGFRYPIKNTKDLKALTEKVKAKTTSPSKDTAPVNTPSNDERNSSPSSPLTNSNTVPLGTGRQVSSSSSAEAALSPDADASSQVVDLTADAATNEADHGLSNHSAVDTVLPIQSKLVQMSNHSAVNTGPTTNYDYIFADIYDTLRFARNDEYPLRGKRSRNGRGHFRNNSKRTLNYPK